MRTRLRPLRNGLPRVPRVTREVRPGDVLAVSATNLQGVYIEDEDQPLMARIRRLRPIGSIGYSILVFRADFSWPEPRSPGSAPVPVSE